MAFVAGAVTVLAGLVVLVGVTREPAVTVLPALAPSLPARPNPVGTWELTHSFRLEPGWRVNSQEVRELSSTSQLAGPDEGGPLYCTMTGHAAGAAMPRLVNGRRVQIGDRPGTYVSVDPKHRSRPHGAFWRGPDGRWANAWCQGGRTPSLALAEQVRFTTTPVRVPLRLDALPTGYHADLIEVRPPEEDAGPDVTLLLEPDEPDGPLPPLYALASPEPLSKVTRKDESLLLDGRPGRASAIGRSVCLTDRQLLCAGVQQTDGVGNANRWPPGQRELVLTTARRLVSADPADRSTWFEGRRAFPG